MSENTALARLKRRVPDDADDTLLADLLQDAEAFILAYTGLSSLPESLQGALTQLAAIYYNRVGAEGESRHAEGTLAVTLDALPDDVRAQLCAHRVGKAVRL